MVGRPQGAEHHPADAEPERGQPEAAPRPGRGAARSVVAAGVRVVDIVFSVYSVRRMEAVWARAARRPGTSADQSGEGHDGDGHEAEGQDRGDQFDHRPEALGERRPGQTPGDDARAGRRSTRPTRAIRLAWTATADSTWRRVNPRVRSTARSRRRERTAAPRAWTTVSAMRAVSRAVSHERRRADPLEALDVGRQDGGRHRQVGRRGRSISSASRRRCPRRRSGPSAVHHDAYGSKLRAPGRQHLAEVQDALAQRGLVGARCRADGREHDRAHHGELRRSVAALARSPGRRRRPRARRGSARPTATSVGPTGGRPSRTVGHDRLGPRARSTWPGIGPPSSRELAGVEQAVAPATPSVGEHGRR